MDVNNSLMSPLASEFWSSWFTLTLSAPLQPYYFLSSLFFFFFLPLPPLSLSNHLSPTCGGVVITLALAWLGLPLSALAAAACVAALLQPRPSIIYTQIYSHTHTHTRTHTHGAHCPGATPDFKLQLTEPEAKPNLEGSLWR